MANSSRAEEFSLKLLKFLVVLSIVLMGTHLLGCANSNRPMPLSTPTPGPTATSTPVLGNVWFGGVFGATAGMTVRLFYSYNGVAEPSAAVSVIDITSGSPSYSIGYSFATTIGSNIFGCYSSPIIPTDYKPGDQYVFSTKYNAQTASITCLAPGGNPQYIKDGNGAVTEVTFNYPGNVSAIDVWYYSSGLIDYHEDSISGSSLAIPVSTYGSESAGTSFIIDAWVESSYTNITNAVDYYNSGVNLNYDYVVTVGF